MSIKTEPLTIEELQNFILMGILATQESIYLHLISKERNGLSNAIDLIEDGQYGFESDFFSRPTPTNKPGGPGYQRLRALRDDIKNKNKSIAEASQKYYEPGSAHPRIVKFFIAASSKVKSRK